MSPHPEVSFTGPVDGALDPIRAVQLMVSLQEALETVNGYESPSRVSVAVADGACTAEIQFAGPPSDGEVTRDWPAELGDSAAEAGISLTVRTTAESTRLRWSVPLNPSAEPAL
jgi:hypothetical protein